MSDMLHALIESARRLPQDGLVSGQRRPSCEVLMHLAIEERATIQHAAHQVGTPTFLTDEALAKLDPLGSEAYRRE